MIYDKSKRYDGPEFRSRIMGPNPVKASMRVLEKLGFQPCGLGAEGPVTKREDFDRRFRLMYHRTGMNPNIAICGFGVCMASIQACASMSFAKSVMCIDQRKVRQK